MTAKFEKSSFEMTWDEMTRIEPQLLALAEEARNTEERTHEAWRELKSKIVQLVGFSAEKRELSSSNCYEIATTILYDMLMDGTYDEQRRANRSRIKDIADKLTSLNSEDPEEARRVIEHFISYLEATEEVKRTIEDIGKAEAAGNLDTAQALEYALVNRPSYRILTGFAEVRA